jgi:hypothetical protein
MSLSVHSYFYSDSRYVYAHVICHMKGISFVHSMCKLCISWLNNGEVTANWTYPPCCSTTTLWDNFLQLYIHKITFYTTLFRRPARPSTSACTSWSNAVSSLYFGSISELSVYSLIHTAFQIAPTSHTKTGQIVWSREPRIGISMNNGHMPHI